MQVTLYNNQSSPETVSKKITKIKQFNCSLKDDTNISEPIIVMSKNQVSDVVSFNYAYLDLFKRYYYLDLPTERLGGMLEIQGHVDVLQSHSTAIKNLNALVERQQNFYNLYLPNLQIPNLSYRRVQTFQFPEQPLNIGGTMILAVCGKG